MGAAITEGCYVVVKRNGQKRVIFKKDQGKI
jgi:hypothetical protein